MIRYSEEEGFIKPTGIRFREGQDEYIILPKVAVGVFSHHLFRDVIQRFSCKEVGYMKTANFERDIYILEYKGEKITFFMAGVSGPYICDDIEELHAQGVEKFIIFGNCGVLDSKIDEKYPDQKEEIKSTTKYSYNTIKSKASELKESLLNKYSDKTIIIVSHRRENIDLFDKVIYLEQGNLINLVLNQNLNNIEMLLQNKGTVFRNTIIENVYTRSFYGGYLLFCHKNNRLSHHNKNLLSLLFR